MGLGIELDFGFEDTAKTNNDEEYIFEEILRAIEERVPDADPELVSSMKGYPSLEACGIIFFQMQCIDGAGWMSIDMQAQKEENMDNPLFAGVPSKEAAMWKVTFTDPSEIGKYLDYIVQACKNVSGLS